MKRVIYTAVLLGILFVVLVGVVACVPDAEGGVNSQKVVRVIDGDTLKLANGKTVRPIGIDTPEKGQCGYAEAKRNLERLILNKRVTLVADGNQKADRYGRLLRYVDLGGKDIGLEQIKAGLAKARYDSRDDYPRHAREDRYHREDNKSKDVC